MSIFGKIVSAIFGHAEAATPSATAQTATAATPAAGTASASAPASAAPAAPVDVDAVLTALAAKSSQQLNWKESIVDLLKLLGLDSSLDARKQLATELKYTGDQNDSATMNVWLIKEVRQKLAENGGKVPAGL
ncbi:hypothetical protein AA0242T_2999 [Acetobacter aceti NRIC 0242]|uniref:DUF3597 domain-containing protein n=1 Tax=Acetobacter aceti NBRC 14818 TaxID=887700 RepID=A0AB33II37_ACEAC|nr:DUF3597 domain-containing protein [Acetobacter aceti]TCS29425.1 uncharacterized protein DUF3597 [Acetobacter aceti NBRC 14818]BCK76554.1 hypothetical protein EMQ_2160 [Acetobacter aceti NBRC 14818]GAN57279.1 hypothetical protein Abac_015_053 [Acetobacter aceti NBRC 14818]GBO82297.1 hypothetical protein AA0242T_2999 [Acetobacter aceti NRIC 0242]